MKDDTKALQSIQDAIGFIRLCSEGEFLTALSLYENEVRTPEFALGLACVAQYGLSMVTHLVPVSVDRLLNTLNENVEGRR